MREAARIADELDDLFEQCKGLLKIKPVPHSTFMNALIKIGDLRSELTTMIGEHETLIITSRAYQDVFQDTPIVESRGVDEIINNIALCYRQARKSLSPQKALIFICMIILIDRYEKELRSNIGYLQARLLIAFLCRTEFLRE